MTLRRLRPARPLLLAVLCAAALSARATSVPPAPAAADPVVREALAAEAAFDSNRALELFLQALATRPEDAFLHQKVAQQYSDSVLDTADRDEKQRRAERSLHHARRAAELDPDNPVNVLSVAIAAGKVALHGDARTKVELSRLIREEAERALALDPTYPWAHHVLGRWHHEVVEVGRAARFFAKLLYGGLPPASLDEAVRHLAQAVALEPQNPLHVIELGFAYAAAGRPADARAAWERGLALPEVDKHDAEGKARARAALAAPR